MRVNFIISSFIIHNLLADVFNPHGRNPNDFAAVLFAPNGVIRALSLLGWLSRQENSTSCVWVRATGDSQRSAGDWTATGLPVTTTPLLKAPRKAAILRR